MKRSLLVQRAARAMREGNQQVGRSANLRRMHREIVRAILAADRELESVLKGNAGKRGRSAHK